MINLSSPKEFARGAQFFLFLFLKCCTKKKILSFYSTTDGVSLLGVGGFSP